MCIERDVCNIFWLTGFYDADGPINSISMKQRKICTRSHSCHWRWVRHSRRLSPPRAPLHSAKLDALDNSL